MLKNTFKLSLNNFSIAWKVLLYKIINIIVVFGLTSVVCLPIIRQLIDNNFYTFLQNNVASLALNFNLNAIINTAILIFDEFASIIVSADLTTFAIIAGIVSVCLYYFADSLSHLSIVDDLRSYMSNNLRIGFMNCYISNFGKSIKLSLSKLITALPLDIGIIVSTIAIYSALAKTSLVLAPIIAMLYFILMFCGRIALFIGVESSMVVNDCSIVQALKKNFRILSKKFISIFGNTLFIFVLLLLLNMFAFVFTFGVGLLIIIPFSVLMLSTMRNVVFYETTGMRYYTDEKTVVIPKKLEEQDKFCKVKNII